MIYIIVEGTVIGIFLACLPMISCDVWLKEQIMTDNLWLCENQFSMIHQFLFR